MRKFVLLPAVLLASAVLMAACSSSGSGLTGKAWQWIGSTTTSPASQTAVPDPQNYTIEFKSDGTFAAKADCNSVNGAYVTSDSNGLTITPGPSTQAACGPTSLGQLFVASLATSKSYQVTNNQLVITNIPGTMTLK